MIGAQDFVGGTVLKIGEYHIRVVASMASRRKATPELLEGLGTLLIPYRWSTRFIYLDGWEADAELEKYRKKWEQRPRPIRDQIFGTRTAKIDLDALVDGREDVVAAKADAAAGLVRYGYYSTAIIIMDKDDRIALDNAQRIAAVITQQRASRVSRRRTPSRLAGHAAGNYWANVRRPAMHTLNPVAPVTVVDHLGRRTL